MRESKGILLTWLLFALPVGSIQLTSASPAVLSFEEAVTLNRFAANAPLRISPDGAWIASTVRNAARVAIDPQDDGWRLSRGVGPSYGAEGCDVWIHAIKSTDSRNLTGSKGSSWSPSWSPDGNRLAYYSDRDGQPNVWLWERRTDEIRKASELTTFTGVMSESPVWVSNSTLIVKARSRAADGEEHESTVTVFRSPRGIVPGTSTYDSDEWNLLLWGETNRGDLAVVDLHSGDARRLVSNLVTYRYAVSPDGSRLAYLDSHLADLPKLRPATLGVLEIATGAVIAKAANIQEFGQAAVGPTFSWSPDGTSLAFLSLELAAPSSGGDTSTGAAVPYKRTEGALGTSVNILRIKDGSRLRLSGVAEGVSSSVPLWDRGGQNVYFISNGNIWNGSLATLFVRPVALREGLAPTTIADVGDRRRTFPYEGGDLLIAGHATNKNVTVFERVSITTGKRATLFSIDTASIEEFAVSPSGKDLVLMLGSSHETSDLWRADIRFRSLKRITDLNPAFRSHELGGSQIINFSADDGTMLGATLWLPLGYEPGKRYPMVVWVYPGAFPSHGASSTFPEPFLNMHLLTTRGFAVLFPDVPIKASSPIDDVLNAVMPAVDRAIALGVADEDRLAVMGHSYGGYATLAVITRTNRFKAAIMAAGFGDLVGLHRFVSAAVEDENYGGMGGPPWKFPARYMEGSPIFRIDDIQTPLLMEAGTADYGILPFSDQVFVEMRRLDKQVTYLRYAGEEHVLRGSVNIGDYWGRVLAFLSRELDLDEKAASRAFSSD